MGPDGRLWLLLDNSITVVPRFHATAAERERALSSFRACGVLEKAEHHHLFDLYEIVTGCRPHYPSASTTSLRERVLEAARDGELLVIPGWDWSHGSTSTRKTPVSLEAKVAQQVMGREKELAFEGASYVALPASSWKELNCGAGRSYEVLRREVAKATLLRMSAQAATPDRKRAFTEAAELVADGNVAFGGLFLARRRIERPCVAADETPALTPSQFRRLALQRLPAVGPIAPPHTPPVAQAQRLPPPVEARPEPVQPVAPLAPKEICDEEVPPVAMGDCEYYQRRHDNFLGRHSACVHCPPDYYLGYGKKYCVRFSKELYPKLSERGKAWLGRARENLQKAMEGGLRKNPKIELNNSRFQKFAFGTHAEAYWKAGLHEVPPGDKWEIFKTPDAKEWLKGATWDQASDVAWRDMKATAGDAADATKQVADDVEQYFRELFK